MDTYSWLLLLLSATSSVVRHGVGRIISQPRYPLYLVRCTESISAIHARNMSCFPAVMRWRANTVRGPFFLLWLLLWVDKLRLSCWPNRCSITFLGMSLIYDDDGMPSRWGPFLAITSTTCSDMLLVLISGLVTSIMMTGELSVDGWTSLVWETMAPSTLPATRASCWNMKHVEKVEIACSGVRIQEWNRIPTKQPTCTYVLTTSTCTWYHT